MVNHPDLDTVFAALSDEKRRAVLAQLAQGEAAITELAAAYDKSLPAFLKHIRALETAGLITRRKEGRTNYLRLNPGRLREASDWLAHYRHLWAAQLDSLTTFLESGADNPTTPDV